MSTPQNGGCAVRFWPRVVAPPRGMARRNYSGVFHRSSLDPGATGVGVRHRCMLRVNKAVRFWPVGPQPESSPAAPSMW